MEHSVEKPVLLIQATDLEPYSNLAVEGLLLESLAPYSNALYLWQNENTVVVGVNQNAYAEVAPGFKGYVTRRLSGGGAVYHDAGNLNFTFVSEKGCYSVDKNKQILLNALRSLGFDAQFSGRNDLLIDGKKISGQAYCLRPEACYHHGTILINSNVERIQAALRPSEGKLKSKGVASVASRVGNLVDWNPSITVDEVREAVAKSFTDFYKGCRVDYKSVDYTNPRLRELASKMASDEWVWGRNPSMTNTVTRRFEWGEVTINYETKGDRAVSVEVFSDALDTELPSKLRQTLLETPVHKWNELIES